MAASRAEPVEDDRELERAWWRNTWLVLVRPAAVYAGLRDDSEEAAGARQEPTLLIVWLAGIALVLSTNAAARVLDDFELTGLLVAVWAFIAGGIYGIFGYFGLGALAFAGADAAGGMASYRQTRHVLAYAGVPLALSLVVWAIRIPLYGGDLFKSGGSDTGTGNTIFEALEIVFLAWTLGLLTLGTRVVHGWSWGRAAAACALPALVPALALLRAYGAV